MNILANKYRSVGISVLPIRPDRSKAPAVSTWTQFQDRLATDAEIAELFQGNCGIAAIGGKVSGNLEIYDFDDAGHFNSWEELVTEHLGEAFFRRLLIVRTPRPGFHVHTRCSQIAGNQKLAMKLIHDPANPQRQIAKTLIETKAEGGYVLLPGCPASCHETGRLYELMQGSFQAIPEITPAERETLLSCARSFNEVVRDEAPEIRRQAVSGSTPGNDYAGNVAWADVLRPHGYKFHSKRGDASLWTRPGKEHGISASTNYAGSDYFYPFSTSCYPFDNNRGYNKFAVYALLDHGGDFRAAAKALASQGYGEPSKPKTANHPPPPSYQLSDIIEPLSLKGEVNELYQSGRKPGVDPGFPTVKQHWTLRKGEWTLVTGVPSHGKSSFVDQVIVNLAVNQSWKWAVWSSESRPYQDYMADLMEKFIGKPFNDGYYKRLTESERDAALDFLQRRFRFIAPPEDEESIDRIIQCATQLCADFGIDGLVIDPWNELTHEFGERLSETEYVSRCLKKLRRFASRANIHILLVAHPMKLKKDSAGKYPIPTPYDVSGSAHWRNKADCALCVWRDESTPGESILFIQKIRRRHVGRIGSVALKYDVVTGRFSEPTAYEPRRRREPGDEDE